MQGIRSVISIITDSSARRSAVRALVYGRGGSGSLRSHRHQPRTRQGHRGPLKTSFVHKIRKMFTDYPVLSNAITYGTLCVGAEAAQQMLKNRKGATGHGNSLSAKTFDTAALKRYAAWGFFVIPPIYSKWYQWLDKAFKTSVGSHSLKVMGQKLFLDQFILTPGIVVLFFIGMAWMEGQKSLTEECRTKFMPTFAADCCFWLPVQWFNFQFISPDLRVVFIGVTTFIWLNVLCFIKSVPLTDFAAVSSVTQAKTTVQSKIVAAKGGAVESSTLPLSLVDTKVSSASPECSERRPQITDLGQKIA